MAPGPSGPALRPGEEEWREVFLRLQERFPSVSAQRVAQALRDNHGHAGEAAAVLRDLTGSGVKEADPDDVEHVATILSSPPMFKHVCKEHFKKFDVNHDGVLQWDEILKLVCKLYEEFGLPQPSEGSLKGFFIATDENVDGVLSEREFRRFFEMFLRYAFFDHLKLRQMVEKGQELEKKRSQTGLNAPAEDSTPTNANGTEVDRASEASGGSARQGEAETQVARVASPPPPGCAAPPAPVGPAPTVAATAAAGRRSMSSGAQERSSRHAHRAGGGGGGLERDNHHRHRGEAHSMVACPSSIRCIRPSGVSYRNSTNFQDRSSRVLPQGGSVKVLEHWVRTEDGWLPLVDQTGHVLFERSPPPALEEASRPQSSPKAEGGEAVLPVADVPRSSHSAAGTQSMPLPAPPQVAETRESPQINDEDTKVAIERLQSRFPNFSTEKIAQVLRENGGHAGKAASVLRAKAP